MTCVSITTVSCIGRPALVEVSPCILDPIPHSRLTFNTDMAGDGICSSITDLKDFLRRSRQSVDDRITTNLNNLVLPRRFDPTSTSTSASDRTVRLASDDGRHIDCHTLIDAVFTNWLVRTDILDRCSAYALSHNTAAGTTTDAKAKQQYNTKRWHGDERRYDPYANRAAVEEPLLKVVCDGERGTEEIVRDRTWRVVRSRCSGDDDGVGLDREWQTAFQAWLKRARPGDDEVSA